MIRDIVKDTEQLQKPCKTVTNNHTKSEDFKQLLADMWETAKHHEETSGCVGLAANQVSSDLRVILVRDNNRAWHLMINPVITKHGRGVLESEEGCLSLEGTRTVKRWDTVLVIWKDECNRTHKRGFTGFEATVVQHEIDHLNGKLI